MGRRSTGGGDKEAAEAARLAADREMVAHFRAQKFQGPEWERFTHELLSYGLTSMRAFLRSRSRFLGRYRGSVTVSGDADELASDAVRAGFKRFVRVGLVGGRWLSMEKVPLTEYFFWDCLYEYRYLYHRLVERRQQHPPEDSLDETVLNRADPENSDLLDRVAAVLHPLDMLIFWLMSEGLSYRQIGERLGLSRRQVQTRVANARRIAEALRARRER